MSNVIDISQQLQHAADELNHQKVSWIDKHYVIDLNQKANVLLSSLLRFGIGQEQAVAIEAAKEFLTEVKPIIERIK